MNVYDDRRLAAVAVLESLRAGVPTRTSTQTLPDLRADLTSIIRGDLEMFSQGKIIPGRLIWGSYGQGKTHMLTAMEHLALDMGFAVSRVSLSREVSCHNLAHFYSRVAPSLRTPNSSVTGLQTNLNRKMASELPDSPIQNPGRYVHPLPAIIFEDYFYTDGEEQDQIYGYLMGNKLSLSDFKRIHRACRGQALPKFQRNYKESTDAPALFGLLADAVCFCGYRGWVILIDELELVGRLGRMSRLKAYLNLNWLLNWSGEMAYPIYTLGAAAVSLQDEIWNPADSRRKGDIWEMPELALEKYGMEASQKMRSFFDRGSSDHCPMVKPVAEEQLVKLLEELVRIHGLAYAWDAHLDVRKLLHDLGSKTIRTYIRAALEALDMKYLYQEEVIPEAKELVACTLDEDNGFFVEEDGDTVF